MGNAEGIDGKRICFHKCKESINKDIHLKEAFSKNTMGKNKRAWHCISSRREGGGNESIVGKVEEEGVELSGIGKDKEVVRCGFKQGRKTGVSGWAEMMGRSDL